MSDYNSEWPKGYGLESIIQGVVHGKPRCINWLLIYTQVIILESYK